MKRTIFNVTLFILLLGNWLRLFADEIMKRIPGEGYDSITKTFQQACVSENSNSLYYIGQNTEDVEYYFDQSTSQMTNNLKTAGTAEVNFKIVSGDVTSSLARDYSSDNNSLSLTYSNIINGKTALINNPELTNSGASIINSTSLEKRKQCGDKFLSGIHLGARFFANAKFIFRDEKTKYNFNLKVTYTVLKKTFTDTLIDESLNEFKNDVAILVSAQQFGGDQEAFQGLLSYIGPSPTCTLNNLAPCQAYFQALINYSSFIFPTQLNDMRYIIEQNKGPIPLSYDFSDYARLGFPKLASNSSHDPQIKKAQKQKDALIIMNQKIDDEVENNQRASEFLVSQDTFLLTSNQVSDIQNVADKIKTNINLLKKSIQDCRTYLNSDPSTYSDTDTNSCTHKQLTVFTQLVPYDIEILSPQKTKIESL